MLIKVPSVVNLGLETIKVDIEINLANKGLPGFDNAGKASLHLEQKGC